MSAVQKPLPPISTGRRYVELPFNLLMTDSTFRLNWLGILPKWQPISSSYVRCNFILFAGHFRFLSVDKTYISLAHFRAIIVLAGQLPAFSLFTF